MKPKKKNPHINLRHIEDATQKPSEFFPYCHCGAKMDGQ